MRTEITGTGIKEIKIRGTYPDYRSICRSMEARIKGEAARSPLRGYIPAVVEYDLIHGETVTVQEIVVRDIDLPFLCHKDSDTARAHLAMILRARQGDRKAASALSEAVRECYPHLRASFGSTEPFEDRYVVPSTSMESHSEEKVSHKGSILLRLRRLGFPVPDFCILSSPAYQERKNSIEENLARAVENLSTMTGQEILQPSSMDDTPPGNCLLIPKEPLVLALRCAMPRYTPGIMPTYLNVGVTESALPRLIDLYGEKVAYRVFCNNLKNLYRACDREGYRAVKHEIRDDLTLAELTALVDRMVEAVRKHDQRLVADPLYQLAFLTRQAYTFYEQNLDLIQTFSRGAQEYPAIIIQKMVCTVREEQSYAGVLTSRHSMTGTGIQLDTAQNIFGEAIMTGTVETTKTACLDRLEIKNSFPAVYHFAPTLDDLEKEFLSPVTIEFATEVIGGHQFFALLQLNNTEMAGRAAFVSAIDMYEKKVISAHRVTELICPYHIKQMEADTIDVESFDLLEQFSEGISILPRSVVCARIYFSVEAAFKSKFMGNEVCLCKRSFKPGDTAVMRELDGIISMTSAAIHVVTICQSFGVPALLNMERFGVRLTLDGKLVNKAGAEIHEGDWVTISSRRQALFKGRPRFRPARLMQYVEGQEVELDADEEEAFMQMAHAYRKYNQLVQGMKPEGISKLKDLIRLVNLELRGETERCRQLVNGWFDANIGRYVEEVFTSDMGDHLNQSTVFNILTLDRRILFFKKALSICKTSRISGYSAGAFMLGRFICTRQTTAFWRSFTPDEIALLLNEWVLFEKYMQLLHRVGDRKIARAKKQFLDGGLDDLALDTRMLRPLITLKLSRIPIDSVRAALPDWSDPQTRKTVDLLEKPYGAFYDFGSQWSFIDLKRICTDEQIPVPGPDDL